MQPFTDRFSSYGETQGGIAVINRLAKGIIVTIVSLSAFFSTTSAFALGDYNRGILYAIVPVNSDEPDKGTIQVCCFVRRFFDRIVDVDLKAFTGENNSMYPWDFEVKSYSLTARKKDGYGVVIQGVVNIRYMTNGEYRNINVNEEL
ncbi:hypothetical protein GTO89_16365 [Heliobacterium gestii]|uniref:Uncharacterized protein n=1 Tax=Heliomicrobium gestii TaxID=2699 RepID=A0A845LJP0_HELGE|nr:hypothetical protein [Heliomicrobium gestii]MBM7868466.1 hypothetical protein [Heliomicrobium gestii]MZP44605.1 hypothetical protein [Heliomicrobium gestii]